MALQPVAEVGAVAGDASHAIAAGTLAAGSVAVQTGAETLAPTTPTGAAEQHQHELVRASFAIETGDIAAALVFTVTQTAGPTLTFTSARTPYGFAITPTAQPAANTLYAFGYTSA